MRKWIVRRVLALMAVILAGPSVQAQDIETEAWPELSVWISLNEAQTTRILLLNSYARDTKKTFDETVVGASLDRKLTKHLALRAGGRYIFKEQDAPTQEFRTVLDLSLLLPFGRGWRLSDRNRLDFRWVEQGAFSTRYRNRLMLEKTFVAGSRAITPFASYEIYYDTRFDAWTRQRATLGISAFLTRWLSTGVSYRYHIEMKPRDQNVGAWGVAIGIYL